MHCSSAETQHTTAELLCVGIYKERLYILKIRKVKEARGYKNMCVVVLKSKASFLQSRMCGWGD